MTDDAPPHPRSGITATARRRRLRRALGWSLAHLWRATDASPLGPPMRRFAQRGLELTNPEVRLRRGHAALDGLRIAFLSDLHAGLFLRADGVRRVATRVAAAEPDLVCLGGDLINTRLRELRELAPLFEILAPPLGIYAVPGNHDRFRRFFMPRWRQAMWAFGATVLENRGLRLTYRGATVWLCGVDDLTEGKPDLDAALGGRRAGEPAILLSHHPDLFVDAAPRAVDLQLSGHTHGGQVRFGRFAPFDHSQHGLLAGLHERAGAQVYVGRGVGVTVAPLRVGVRPEIPILRLRRD